MGKKYILNAFDYPFQGYYDYCKQTDWMIVAIMYFIIFSIKYFGVTVDKRG